MSPLKTAAPQASVLVNAAAAIALLYVFGSILWPLALAILITVIIQAGLRAVLRLWPGANRQLILLLGGGGALIAILWAAIVALPAITALARDLPRVLPHIDAALTNISYEFGLENPITLQILFGGLDARTIAFWMLGSLRGAITGLALTALFVVFLLMSWDLIGRRVGLSGGRRARAIASRSLRGIETYLGIQTLTSFLNAGAAAVVMFAVGLDHWLLWAIALFVLAYIPFIGIAVGSIAPALMALLQFPSGMPSLIIFLTVQIVAFVVGNLIAPRLIASAQNLDPSIALLTVGAWSILWGLPGAFLAVPLTLALVYALAADPRLAWLATLMSNDGFPLRRKRRRDVH